MLDSRERGKTGTGGGRPVASNPGATQTLSPRDGVRKGSVGARSTREDIRLHNHPAVESALLQKRQNSGKVEVALAERREDTVPDRGMEIHASGASFGGPGVVDILQMNTPNSGHLPFEKGDGIAAAIRVVSGVETQSQLIGGKQSEKAVNFFRSFYVAAGVMMKRHPQTE